MQKIDNKHCELALAQCDTASFEKFIQAFHAALVGTQFFPLGGMNDGGADGYEELIFDSQFRPAVFLQASKTKDYETKIDSTARRLVDFGRKPTLIIFYFSSDISNADAIEEKHSIKHDIVINIRNKGYIVAHINDNTQTIQAYNSYLKPSIMSLLHIGVSPAQNYFPADIRTLCVFLGQEVNRRLGNTTALNTVTDSLILWSLEGTDPDKGILMSPDEIKEKILGAMPSAKQFIGSVFLHRLHQMSKKENASGRLIRWHKKINRFALPYETRQQIIDENVDDVNLFVKFKESIFNRVKVILSNSSVYTEINDIVNAIQACVQRLFEEQGISISVYLTDNVKEAGDAIDITQTIDKITISLSRIRKQQMLIQNCISEVVASLIYEPNAIERAYMQRLSRTYFLFFALKNEPKIVEYFNGMASQMILYVGSDMIIKALSEYYLSESGRPVTTALEIIGKRSGKLILTGTALEEIFTHIRASDREFKNHYATIENIITSNLISGIDRILIRSYFYARRNKDSAANRPIGWRSFISQFCSYDKLQSGEAKDGLRIWLCSKFEMEFEPEDKMLALIDHDEVDKLKVAILTHRQSSHKEGGDILARNDALHALRIYSKRSEIGEVNAVNPFGFRVWWLTQEQAVQRAVVTALGRNKPRFIIRPEFLLNYIALLPEVAEISKSHREIFPSILAVTLSRRLDPKILRETLAAAKSAYEVDEHRARAMLVEFSDQLKADRLRHYEVNCD